jgi:phosphonate ABC transporter permease subunit PhnE
MATNKENNTGKRSRPLLRAFIIFIAIVGGFILYAYAIDVTEINFTEPQDPRRQAVTVRVIRALARPDFFVFNEESRTMNVMIRIPCAEEVTGSQFELSDGRTVTISPNCANTTQDMIVVTGSGFHPNTSGLIRWYPPGDTGTTRAVTSFKTDKEGNLNEDFTMPDIRPSDEPQRLELEETWKSGGFLGTGIIGFSETVYITIEKIVETVLLALMATTVGTLLAVPVGFLAARNLMENIGLPLAAILSAVIGLLIGYVLGDNLTKWLLGVASTLTNDTLTGLGIAFVLLLLIGAVLKFAPGKLSAAEQSRLSSSIGWLRVMFVIVTAFFVIAILAYLGIVLGKSLESSLGGAAFLARFISFLSEGITVLSPMIVGLTLGLIGVSLGSTYGQEAILRTSVTTGRIITGVVAAIGGAIFIFGAGSALNWLYQFDYPQNWTTYPALIGGVILLAVGLFINPKRQFPIGMAVYTVLRSLLNIIRSIEPLIYVIVFAVWVGIGPFAGVMALTIHTIAALGKLYSEQVESVSDGPIEAITATGASRVQTVVYAVVPQVVPPFIAFTLYRWDINVRFSTVIGFAGGGGIGFVLVQNINLLKYRQASVMMIAIAVVVISLDYLSSKIRKKII